MKRPYLFCRVFALSERNQRVKVVKYVSKEEMLQDPVDQKRRHDTRQVTKIIMSPLFCFPSSFCCWCCKNEAMRHLGVDNLGTHHVSQVRGENTAEAGKGHPRAHGR